MERNAPLATSSVSCIARQNVHDAAMKDGSPTTSTDGTVPDCGNRWSPVLPFFVSLLGSVTFIFDADSTFLGTLSTFGMCFMIAYVTQVVFGRFLVALPLLMTVPTFSSESQKPQPEREVRDEGYP